MILGFGLVIMGCLLFLLLVPETLHLHNSKAQGLDSDPVPEPEQVGGVRQSLLSEIRTQVWENFKNVWAATTIFHSPAIIVLLLTFILEPYGAEAGGITLRYISKQYGWTLAETGFLLSLRALVNMVLLLIILPGLSYYMTERLAYSAKSKDLHLSKGSVMFSLLAALLLSLGSSIGLTIAGLATWTLGTGYAALARSLITSLVDKQHVGRLYAAIAVVETLGSLTAAPILASMYSLGLKWKGAWIRLPFYCLVVVCILSALGIWSFGLLVKERKPDFGDDDIIYGDEPARAAANDAVLLQTEHIEASLLD